MAFESDVRAVDAAIKAYLAAHHKQSAMTFAGACGLFKGLLHWCHANDIPIDDFLERACSSYLRELERAP